MRLPKRYTQIYTDLFHNSTEKEMTKDFVFERIYDFIARDPNGQFLVIVGTDSQARTRFTRYWNTVVVQRLGKGGWFAHREIVEPRRVEFGEKIPTELTYSEEMAYFIDAEKRAMLEDLIMPFVYQGASIDFEVHLDIGDGEQNRTRIFVDKFKTRVLATGFKPVIKPDAYVAQGICNRFSK